MSGSTNVLFGGVPINIAISVPSLNSGAGQGLSPSCGGAPVPTPVPDPCTCPVAPGNGISPIYQGSSKCTVLATQNLLAFSAVVFGTGGVQIAANSVLENRDLVAGVTLNGPLAGQLAHVVCSGLVVNTISGTGGWAFTVNGPVYVGADGQLTQTAPVTGWVRKIGRAVAANTVLLDIPVLNLAQVNA